MSKENTTVETTTAQIDADVEALFGADAGSITIPSSDEPVKPSIFSKPVNPMLGFEMPEKTDSKEIKDPVEKKNPVEKKDPDVITDPNEIEDLLDTKNTTKNKGTKLNKDGLIEATRKLIEKKVLIPFDDEKSLEDYTMNDFQELIEANFDEREKKVRETTPVEFFQSLPEEIQYAAQYVSNGGTDLKGLFRAMAQVHETVELDPTNPSHQESIVRNYLSATNFGTPEDIEEEINGWKDRSELETKANKFKPKLDAMQQQIVAGKLKQSEALRKQQDDMARMYMKSVYDTLAPGDINGIKLDKKTQNMLYAGLVQSIYPSVSGKATNLLGHLLERYQYVEPDHSRIAEVLWLLSDRDGFKAELKKAGSKEAIDKTVRSLKTEQQNRLGSTVTEDEDDEKSKTGKIARPGRNFFGRT